VPPSLFLAGASPRRATIALFGWRIPSPRHHHYFLPVHPLAVPPLPTYAGASHRHASIAYLGRRIPSPHRPIVFQPVHLIAAHPSPISVCALTRCRTARRNIKVVTYLTPAPPPHQY
jgi:hypothetical protein